MGACASLPAERKNSSYSMLPNKPVLKPQYLLNPPHNQLECLVARYCRYYNYGDYIIPQSTLSLIMKYIKYFPPNWEQDNDDQFDPGDINLWRPFQPKFTKFNDFLSNTDIRNHGQITYNVIQHTLKIHIRGDMKILDSFPLSLAYHKYSNTKNQERLREGKLELIVDGTLKLENAAEISCNRFFDEHIKRGGNISFKLKSVTLQIFYDLHCFFQCKNG